MGSLVSYLGGWSFSLFLSFSGLSLTLCFLRSAIEGSSLLVLSAIELLSQVEDFDIILKLEGFGLVFPLVSLLLGQLFPFSSDNL